MQTVNSHVFTNKLSKGKALGSWIARLRYLPPQPYGYTVAEIAYFVGISKRTVHDFFGECVPPSIIRKIVRQRVFFYSDDTVIKVGREFHALNCNGRPVYKLQNPSINRNQKLNHLLQEQSAV